MNGRPSRRTPWSYEYARSREDALEAATCAQSWLEELAGMDLGHEGNHAVDEARKNIRAVAGFVRRRARKEIATCS